MRSSERSFTQIKDVHRGRPRLGNVVQCGKCDAKKTHWPGSGINPILSKKFFVRLGWAIGKGPRADRCPDCLQNITNPSAATSKPPVKIQEAQKMTASTQDPRKLGRDERRLIFAKLEDVYVDEKTGYAMGWTDQKVADDLGVPRAWVTTIRDENFGSLAANAEVSKDMEELHQIKALVNSGVEFVEKELASLKKAQRQVVAMESRLSKALQ